MFITRNLQLFIFPLQVKNKPYDGVAKRVFILELGMVANS